MQASWPWQAVLVQARAHLSVSVSDVGAGRGCCQHAPAACPCTVKRVTAPHVDIGTVLHLPQRPQLPKLLPCFPWPLPPHLDSQEPEAEEVRERVFLVGAAIKGEQKKYTYDVHESVEELGRLAETAGLKVGLAGLSGQAVM